MVKKRSNRKVTCPTIINSTAALCAVIGLFVWIPLPHLLPQYGIAKLAQSGDFFGGTAGPLLSFASLLLLLSAFLLQRKDLILTREEMQLTRQEFEAQNATLALQRFDNTFFNLLSLYNQIVGDLAIEALGDSHFVTLKGRTVFTKLYEHLRSAYSSTQIKERNPNRLVDELIRIHEAFSVFYKNDQSFVGHYFRHIYQIVRFINEFDMPESDKARYIRFLRAQFSSYELVLLFYNSMSDKGYEHFLPLLKQYDFFRGHIDPAELLHQSHLEVFQEFERLIQEESFCNLIYR